MVEATVMKEAFSHPKGEIIGGEKEKIKVDQRNYVA